MSTQWVQHISGQGEKWKVVTGFNKHRVNNVADDEWPVYKNNNDRDEGYLIFPKSEYRLCDPPETWVDVTAVCKIPSFTSHVHKDHCEVWHGSNRLFVVGNELVTDYRLRKVEVNLIGPGVPHGCQKQWAFIVERKEVQP